MAAAANATNNSLTSRLDPGRAAIRVTIRRCSKHVVRRPTWRTSRQRSTRRIDAEARSELAMGGACCLRTLPTSSDPGVVLDLNAGRDRPRADDDLHGSSRAQKTADRLGREGVRPGRKRNGPRSVLCRGHPDNLVTASIGKDENSSIDRPRRTLTRHGRGGLRPAGRSRERHARDRVRRSGRRGRAAHRRDHKKQGKNLAAHGWVTRPGVGRFPVLGRMDLSARGAGAPRCSATIRRWV